jgi:rod shape-determining protein MreC
MYQLFQYLYNYRAFLLFLLLEFISFWLLVRTNPYQSAAFFHSSNQITGTLYNTRTSIAEYFDLKKVNQRLAQDNAGLREIIAQRQAPVLITEHLDSTMIPEVPTRFRYLAAKVINNSTRKFHNYITINRGSRHGVEVGMGVISDSGVIGKVLAVSDRFAVIVSLLNTELLLSARIKRNNTLCTVNWDGRNAIESPLLYVPRHVDINKGDSIVTSGYNGIFPEQILIGTIKEISLESNATFFNITIALSEDFYKLHYVYVVRNPVQAEKNELEASLIPGNE